MAYRTFIASLGVVALVLAASEAFADPGAARGAAVAPARPAFPSFPRSIHNHHRGPGAFWPAGGGVFYGLPPDAVDEPVVVAPPLKQSDDLRYTCVYDIPWDYVHRCPQFR